MLGLHHLITINLIYIYVRCHVNQLFSKLLVLNESLHKSWGKRREKIWGERNLILLPPAHGSERDTFPMTIKVSFFSRKSCLTREFLKYSVRSSFILQPTLFNILWLSFQALIFTFLYKKKSTYQS